MPHTAPRKALYHCGVGDTADQTGGPAGPGPLNAICSLADTRGFPAGRQRTAHRTAGPRAPLIGSEHPQTQDAPLCGAGAPVAGMAAGGRWQPPCALCLGALCKPRNEDAGLAVGGPSGPCDLQVTCRPGAVFTEDKTELQGVSCDGGSPPRLDAGAVCVVSQWHRPPRGRCSFSAQTRPSARRQGFCCKSAGAIAQELTLSEKGGQVCVGCARRCVVSLEQSVTRDGPCGLSRRECGVRRSTPRGLFADTEISSFIPAKGCLRRGQICSWIWEVPGNRINPWNVGAGPEIQDPPAGTTRVTFRVLHLPRQ